MKARLLLAVALLSLGAPLSVRAQMPMLSDSTGTVELGFVQEWFHRDLAPAPYADTQWSITSLLLTCVAGNRLSLGLQGGITWFESEDFPESQFSRYAIGGALAIRVASVGSWNVGISGRYLETFDFDDKPTRLHKRVQSASGLAFAGRPLRLLDHVVIFRAGPIYVDDRIETYAWDSREPFESSDGGAWGGAIDVHAVVFRHIAVYGSANYVDHWQGGIGMALHAGKEGL